MVMEGDSPTRGCVFESQHQILDGHFSHYFVIQIVCLKRPKINKEGDANFPFKKLLFYSLPSSTERLPDTLHTINLIRYKDLCTYNVQCKTIF